MKKYILYMIIVLLSLLSLPLCAQVDCTKDSVSIFYYWYRQNELKLIVKDDMDKYFIKKANKYLDEKADYSLYFLYNNLSALKSYSDSTINTDPAWDTIPFTYSQYTIDSFDTIPNTSSWYIHTRGLLDRVDLGWKVDNRTYTIHIRGECKGIQSSPSELAFRGYILTKDIEESKYILNKTVIFSAQTRTPYQYMEEYVKPDKNPNRRAYRYRFPDKEEQKKKKLTLSRFNTIEYRGYVETTIEYKHKTDTAQNYEISIREITTRDWGRESIREIKISGNNTLARMYLLQEYNIPVDDCTYRKNEMFDDENGSFYGFWSYSRIKEEEIY